MLTLISEVSAISETVSSTCDIALVDGNEVMVVMSAWTGDLALTSAPMAIKWPVNPEKGHALRACSVKQVARTRTRLG